MAKTGSRRTTLLCLLGGSLLACSDPAERARLEAEQPRLVVYSGRNESLIGPLLELFEQEQRIDLAVRYGATSELTATLLEEGSKTPADVFISQDALALGALAAAGLLEPLDPGILRRLPERFRSPSGLWGGLSGRARTLVYAPERIGVDELPRSLDELVAPRFKGRYGVAPTNGSFQAHMAVYGAVAGAEALGQLLTGMTANDPRRYPKNSAVVEAVISGEIDFGLVNHYYLWRAKSEDPSVTAENFFMAEGEASSFINIAGIAALSENPLAQRLIEFLLSEPSQHYFAEETFEYPLVPGVPPSAALMPLSEVRSPEIGFGEVSAVLAETLNEISRSGLVQ
jgi:iron(III) transport system substrate-binding protein